jgi:signal transduction histidine kinase
MTLSALHYDGDALRIRVADDGIGFDARPGTGAGGAQLGLVGMRERASLLGGRRVVSSTPGRGTVTFGVTLVLAGAGMLFAASRRRRSDI